MKPLEFIDLLRNSDVYIKSIYSMGGCYQFHLILKRLFPEADPHLIGQYNRATGKVCWGHVVTEINGVYYDINGIFEMNKTRFDHIKPLENNELEMVEKWSFSRNYFLSKECPVCEEPILIEA